jgi:membrane protein YdbS with pleckstrin-like domain
MQEAPEDALDRPVDVRTVPALREPAHLVSPRAVRMWTVRALLVSLVPLGLQVAWWLADGNGPSTPQLAVGAAWVLLTAAYAIAMPRWRYRVHRWEATPVAIYTQTGWLSQERRVAPVSRVQTVDLHRGPLAQLFGLASVTVTTASAAGPLEIQGLELDTARALVDALTRATVAEEGDAT